MWVLQTVSHQRFCKVFLVLQFSPKFILTFTWQQTCLNWETVGIHMILLIVMCCWISLADFIYVCVYLKLCIKNIYSSAYSYSRCCSYWTYCTLHLPILWVCARACKCDFDFSSVSFWRKYIQKAICIGIIMSLRAVILAVIIKILSGSLLTFLANAFPPPSQRRLLSS